MRWILNLPLLEEPKEVEEERPKISNKPIIVEIDYVSNETVLN